LIYKTTKIFALYFKINTIAKLGGKIDIQIIRGGRPCEVRQRSLTLECLGIFSHEMCFNFS
jgi:hypothetical protein